MTKLGAIVIARLPRRGDSEYYAAIVTAFDERRQIASLYVMPPNGRCFVVQDAGRDDLIDRGDKALALAPGWMVEAP